MPSSHGKQKQAEKQKKRREAARKQQQARRAALALPVSAESLARRAASLPHGPTFISTSWRDASEALPELVTVIVTRRAPGGLFIPATAMVDRTCLGIKNAFLGRPVPLADLETYLQQLESRQPMEPCELLVAQSVVFHAIDHARSLGFAPHPDFPAALFGPRPEHLLDTPLARPSRPIYVSGPYDDVPEILEKLRRTGADFGVVAGGPAGDLGLPLGSEPALADADRDDGEEDEDEDEDEAE